MRPAVTVRGPDGLDVLAAAARLAPHIPSTPVLEDSELNARVGGRVLIKAECLQTTGSFKLRGAFNRLLQLTAEERSRGVVAWSAGNHAQALAFAGSRLGVPVHLLMPLDAAATKVEGARRWGASIRFYDRLQNDREALGAVLAEEIGAIVVPPFDDPDVIAGGGTAALELIDHARAAGIELDCMVVPVGGGGLIAGCGLGARERGCNCSIMSAEPVGWDDMRRSLEADELVPNPQPASAADALLTAIGPAGFALARKLVEGGIALSDSQLAGGVEWAVSRLRLVVELGGVAALAAVLTNSEKFTGKVTGVVVTGGNIDAGLLADLLSSRRGESDHPHVLQERRAC